MSRKRPRLPNQFTSEIPSSYQEELKAFKVRSASYTSQKSGLSTSNASDMSEYLRVREAELFDELEQSIRYAAVLRASAGDLNISKDDLDTALNQADRHKHVCREELEEIVKRPRGLHDDLSSIPCKDVDAAYAQLVMSKTMASSGKQKKSSDGYKPSVFKSQVLEYYGAKREDGAAFCVVFNEWLGKEEVKAGHIVPRAFQSSELDRLFGEEVKSHSDVRNGMYFCYCNLLLIIIKNN